MTAKPFLKWAGGKTQLLSQFDKFYPIELKQHKINQYVEPFVGSGAVFFEVVQKFTIKKAFISDINQDLILAYRVIQKNPDALLELLEKYQNRYNTRPMDKRKDLFLEVRKQFNAQRTKISYQRFSKREIKRAAQLIFLNKTCFNGLFRLNSKKEFNVPFGNYKKPKIWDVDNIQAVSKILQNTEIQCANYQAIFDKADENTFIYFDPPYRPLSQTARFTSYTDSPFTDIEQTQLAVFFQKLAEEKPAKLMLSNSDPKNQNPNDHFFENLYGDYYIHRVRANRMINSNAQKRGPINELLITNYRYEP
jgi:DNA adenine methylase